ncbi:MAG: hypothetical protein AB8C84_09055 [Oligoflexales bacterium]
MESIRQKTILLLSLLCITFCAKPGADEAGITNLGSQQDITGSIRSETGAQSDMVGWNIVLFDQKGLIARIAEVNSAGIYTLPQVYTSQIYTLALLSPTFVHQAVLSQISQTESQIHQYFTMNSNVLPTLIHKGPIISFQDSREVDFTKEWAWADASGVPTPLPAPTAFQLSEGEVSTVDAPDSDGILNHEDSDIDNDGYINVIDLNDDGDEFPDLIDQDANGDTITDINQLVSDLHYQKGIQWLVVKYEKIPIPETETFTTTLTFLTLLRTPLETTPRSISIRGASSLFNGATASSINPDTGEVTSVPWDGLLLDDGNNEDGAAEDLLYGRKIQITTQPVARQMVFVELGYGTDEAPWADAYGYSFPNITPGSLAPSYDRLSNTVTLTQGDITDVFGSSVSEFRWTLSIYLVDLDDPTKHTKVFTSGPIASSSTTWSLGEQADSILEDGQTYKYKVSAQVLDRIPGHPAYLIESLLLDIPSPL